MEDVHQSIISNQLANKRTIDLAPRGFGKSTIGDITYCIWRIIQNRNIRILIVSNTQSQAEAFLREIKHHLEYNMRLIEIYGTFKSKKWTESELIVKGRTTSAKEGTVTALGASGAVISKHFDVIIADDLVDFENARTQLQRNKLNDWYSTALLPCLEPDGHLHILGTRYHPTDLYQKFLDNEQYHTNIQSAIQPDGASLWEVKFNVNTLQSLKHELGSIIFNMQYQNDVELAKQGRIFQYNWFNFYICEDLPPIAALDIYMGVDLAISKKETADYFVIMILGISKTNDIYVLDILHERLSFLEQITAIKDMSAKWDPIRIGVESNAYQDAMSGVLIDTTSLPIKKLITVKDKVTRAQSRSALFENGKVHVRLAMTDMVDELCLFPDADHDDYFDAFDLAITAKGQLNQGRHKVKAKQITQE